MKTITTSLLLLLLITSCKKNELKQRCTGFTHEEPTIFEPADYMVWGDVLPLLGTAPFIIRQNIWPLDSSYNPSIKPDSSDLGFEVDSLVWHAYVKANEKEEKWKDNFPISSQLITSSELSCFFQNGFLGWNDYYLIYPRGFWSISRAGIFGDFALVEYTYSCGSVCGESTCLLLKKEAGKWIIFKQGYTVIS